MYGTRRCDAARGKDACGYPGRDGSGRIGKRGDGYRSGRTVWGEPANGTFMARSVSESRPSRLDGSISRATELSSSHGCRDRGRNRGGARAVGMGVKEVAQALERDVSGCGVSGPFDGRCDVVTEKVGSRGEGTQPALRTTGRSNPIRSDRAERVDHGRLQRTVPAR